MNPFWHASEVRYGTSQRCLHLPATSLYWRERFSLTSGLNPVDSFVASPGTPSAVPWASAVLDGVLVVTLVTEPGCPHSSKRPSPQKLLWKYLTRLASTEFSVPRITFRIGACFRVVLRHVWHCCRFIRQIAKNRKVLTSILIVQWVRRKCKFTVLNEKSDSKEELCEGFLLCCIVCCYIETIVLRYGLMGMLIANNRGEVSWFVSRQIFPDT